MFLYGHECFVRIKQLKLFVDVSRVENFSHMHNTQGVSVSGRVVRGRVRAGDKVLVMPLEDPAGVTRLERNGLPARGARAGDNAEVTLSGVDAARVVVGNVLCKAGSVVPVARRFTAQIVALPALEVGCLG